MRIRTEAWDGADGVGRLLLLLGDGKHARACLVTATEGPSGLRVGLGKFPMGAMAADRDGFEAKLGMDRPTGGLLWASGLVDGTPLRAVTTFGNPWPVALSPWDFVPRSASPAVVDRMSAAGYGVDPKWVTAIMVREARVLPSPRKAKGSGIHELATDWGMPFEAWEHTDGKSLLVAWMGEVRARLVPHEVSFLSDHAWSDVLLEHYTAPGTVGSYRRQAGGLYPALAPVLANDPGLRSLVDAGRPFEREASRLLGDMRGIDGVTVAKLRRLKGRRLCCDRPDALASLVEFVAAHPAERLDRLFGTGDLPGLDLNAMEHIARWADGLGLDVADLTRSMPPHGTVRVMMQHAYDLPRRLGETLVLPMLGHRASGWSDRIAGHALFAGLPLKEICAVSARWHRRLGAFEAALPQGEDLVDWPALFEPVGYGAFRITCLTLPSELRYEGNAGPDPEGLDGLDHCVGGYARSCFTGSVHVASVRTSKGGRWVRVSTVEFRKHGGRIEAVQHQGRRNTTPPDGAKEAVSALVADLNRGAVEVSPSAYMRREVSDFQDGIAWESRAVREQAWNAWTPYLSKRVAGMGLDGFRDMVLADFQSMRRAMAA